MRLFLGIALTDRARAALGTRLRDIVLPGRVVAEGQWHLTLAFIGSVEEPGRAALDTALRAEPLGTAFEIVFEGLGAFPRAARATVIWVGVGGGAEALRALHERVSHAVGAEGLRREARPYAAHLTLSRMRTPGDVRALVAAWPPLGVVMPVEEVTLFRSHLGSAPARYEPLARYPLEPPSPGGSADGRPVTPTIARRASPPTATGRRRG